MHVGIGPIFQEDVHEVACVWELESKMKGSLFNIRKGVAKVDIKRWFIYSPFFEYEIKNLGIL